MNNAFPKDVGACLARLAALGRQIEKAEARLKPLADEEAALREHMIGAFAKTDLNGARGSGISVAVVTSAKPRVGDWDAFLRFAKRRGNDDLLQHSVSTPAWRERVEAGVAVPGVEAFHHVSLRVTRERGKK